MQRHAESGPPAGLRIARATLADAAAAAAALGGDYAAENAAVARTPTAAASTPRGAADDASDAGTDRDGATQLRKRGRSRFGREEEPRGEGRERGGERERGQQQQRAKRERAAGAFDLKSVSASHPPSPLPSPPNHKQEFSGPATSTGRSWRDCASSER